MPALLTPDQILPEERKYEKELQRWLFQVKGKEVYIDENLVWEAFWMAVRAHRGQTRLSGEPYLSHLVAVLGILAENTLPDSETLAAALLHDVLEDTALEPVELLSYFGETIFTLVKGLTKLSQYAHRKDEELRVENLRKFFFETVQDLRILLIKLSDRLHNLQTLEYLPDEAKRRQIAMDTLDFYAPLAHRFGFYKLKSLLEDEAFHNLNPGQYDLLSRRLHRELHKRESRISRLKRKLEDNLRARFPEMNFLVKGRSKHVYSIYQKMQEQNLSFEEIRDLYGLRVMVPDEDSCYRALAIVHQIWSYIQGYFRDYIGSPKPNGYRSLHTMVMADDGEPLEIQIRTFEMDRLAEYGVAAHWLYKNGAQLNFLSRDLAVIRELLSSEDTSTTPQYFLQTLKLEVFQQEIFVYTPKGDKVYLPRGSTPLDFAYKIHTEVGHHYEKALVNGQEVPMNYQLQLGDSVEIVTRSDVEPQPLWLDGVKTPLAQFKIKNYLKRRQKELTLLEGRRILEQEILQRGLHALNLLRPSLLKEYIQQKRLKDSARLYRSVLRGELVPREIVDSLLQLHLTQLKKMVQEEKLPPIPVSTSLSTTLSRAALSFHGLRGQNRVLFSKCCYPIYGDSIVGMREKRKIILHRAECAEVDKAVSSQVLTGKWLPHPTILYPAEINIIAPNRRGLLKEIITTISDHGVNILSNTVKLYRKDIGSIRFLLEIQRVQQLEQLIRDLKKEVADILSVERSMNL